MSLSAPKLPDLANKGDFAVFGLGYAFGFGADVLLFGAKSGPAPLTVALVFAIACLAIKSGYEEWLREQSSEESDISEDGISEEQMRAHLKTQFDAFSEFLQVGAEFATSARFEEETESSWAKRDIGAHEILRELWELGSTPTGPERGKGREALMNELLSSSRLSSFHTTGGRKVVNITVNPPPKQGWPVVVEERWEPNPNYSPQAAEEHGELPYRLHRETVHIWPRYWMLRALWEKGLLANEYAEKHLNDLIDLVRRNAQNFTAC